MGQEYQVGPDFEAAAAGPASDWRRMWRRVLSSRSSKKSAAILSKAKTALTQPVAKRKRILHGWESSHTLEASVVTLKNVCHLGEKGLLTPILRRTWAGAADVTVFELKVIRAVISYKWRAYASSIMVLQLCVYLLWVLGFSGFVFVLNSNHFGDASGCADHLCWRNFGLGFLAVSTFASVPFALIEVCTIREYGLYYSVARMHSAMDVAMLSLQYLILVVLAVGGPGTSDRERDDFLNFDVLVAVQLLLLWVRLSQFFRGFKLGNFEPMEMLGNVFWQAKAMLIFLAFIIFGFSLAYTTLFRHDHTAQEFRGLWRSVVTLITMTAGAGVNVADMYRSEHGTSPVALFLIYEVVVSIVLINVLLAVVVQIFQQVMEQGKAHQLRRRAELIDEIDTMLELTGMWKRAWTPTYLHILEMKPQSVDGRAAHQLKNMTVPEMYRSLKDRIDKSHEELMRRIEELAASSQQQQANATPLLRKNSASDYGDSDTDNPDVPVPSPALRRGRFPPEPFINLGQTRRPTSVEMVEVAQQQRHGGAGAPEDRAAAAVGGGVYMPLGGSGVSLMSYGSDSSRDQGGGETMQRLGRLATAQAIYLNGQAQALLPPDGRHLS
mmetsp:Transcript_11789/g.29838  ORF Transcript_11789/g.29838 Transcript_11789/m.29838 type:complete len:609 (+) Transcript_11789:695-2521(+)